MDWTFPEDIPGWLSLIEAKALAELARGRRVLEIGSYCGRSTVSMAQTALFVHAIDWGRGDKGAGDAWTTPALLDNLGRYGVIDKVTVHVGRSVDCGLAGGFDLCFIDGAHDYESVEADCKLAKRLVKKQGVIALHDWYLQDVRKAAKAVFGWQGEKSGLWVADLYVRQKCFSASPQCVACPTGR